MKILCLPTRNWRLVLQGGLAPLLIAAQTDELAPHVRQRDECLQRTKQECRRYAIEELGKTPLLVGEDDVAMPKQLPPPTPEFPKREKLFRVRRPTWVGVLLITTDGDVSKVWVVEGIDADPPWPEFNDAYRDWVKNWKYEARDQDLLPLCTAVVAKVNFS